MSIGSYGYISTEAMKRIKDTENFITKELSWLHGRRLIWKNTHQTEKVGREALVMHTIYDGKVGDICVLVKTANKANMGWMRTERYYANLTQFEEVIINEANT